MRISGLRFIDYKSFIGEYAIIDEFPNITVFIGRNNSGKSSCIDIIESLTKPDTLARYQKEQKDFKVEIGRILTDQDIRKVFHENTSGGMIPGNHYAFGRKYIGKEMYFDINTKFRSYSDGVIYHYQYTSIPDEKEFPVKYHTYWDQFASDDVNVFKEYKFRRLGAERDIMPEEESDSETVTSSGVGASNLVRKFLNFSEYDERLIEEKLMDALNQIIYPDSEFSGIRVQQVRSEKGELWEIFLQEGTKRYALSKMGSGLKTLILVLINLLIIPETKAYKDNKIIYAFEELENNLHPALQRRLFDYIFNYCIKNKIMVFLTTHSHVAINSYCNIEHAQIYHVIKKNGISSLHKIDDYIGKSSLLNDLDVRASDLLQSNGIVWVEGPSDRVYINKWIEIYSSGKLKEGRDYQILYYGGRLLAHYSADDEQRELLNVLMTNRNAAIVIDSDKRSSQSHINDTKKRVKEEFKKYQAFCWITQGKEIENYIPYVAIEKAYNKKLNKQCGQYELFPEYVKSIEPHFIREKVLFSHKVCQFISAENSLEILDLKKQIDKLIDTIQKWNPKYFRNI